MKKNLKILLFTPHSAIWEFSFPEALIAEALQQKNHQIVYITCGEEFKEYCNCMYSLEESSSPLDKKKICKICNTQKEIIKKSFDFNGYDLEKVLTEQKRQEIEKIIKQITSENFLNLKLNDIDIGKAALYEFLLKHKKISLSFSEQEWSSYLISLRNTLRSFFACRTILEQEKPDRVITYNSLYSVNRVCCQLAQSMGIPVYFLHAGFNLSNYLQTILIGQTSTYAFIQELRKFWSFYQDIPCSQASLELVTNHFLELLKGKSGFVYSSTRQGKNIKEFFGVQKT